MRLALVHGFTQTGRSWDPLRPRFEGAGLEVVTPDLAGHGTRGAQGAGLAADGARLAGEVGAATWIGYSMGGRVCLHLALDHPEVVRGLVLVSTTAGIDSAEERAQRRASDDDLAASVEALGVAAFVDRWLAGPMWAGLSRQAAGVEARLANTAAGLAGSLRLAGTGSQEPLWERLAEIHVPVLVITGDRDAKFSALGDRLAQALTGADVTRAAIPAGHAVPWEAPDAFIDAVGSWLGLSQGPGPR